jgi:hypothetical protein
MRKRAHRISNREQLLYRGPIELTDAQDMATGESHDMHSIVDLLPMTPDNHWAHASANTHVAS